MDEENTNVPMGDMGSAPVDDDDAAAAPMGGEEGGEAPANGEPTDEM